MTPIARYQTLATRHAFRGCDPLTQPIVHAIAEGREMPEEFAILDTYYDIGAPEVEQRCETIREEVRRITSAAGIPMARTFTMIDGGAA
jgi:hypothetical protein